MKSSEFGLKGLRKTYCLPEEVCSSFNINEMEDTPFPDLKVNEFQFLDEINGRQSCSKCGKSRKYYCYTCFLPVPCIKDRIPQVKLPLKVDIIKHPNEVDGKSTAAHAAVIAPEDVTVYTYPCIPDYKEKDKILLVFPCEEALTFKEYIDRFCSHIESPTTTANSTKEDTSECDNNRKRRANDTNDSNPAKKPCTDLPSSSEGTSVSNRDLSFKWKFQCKIERVVFIDSTWYQVKKISGDERLQGLQPIELKTRKTKFWRHQKDKPDTYLATIEAIYYFICDFHEHFIVEEQEGQYDNLLFFFCFMYDKIRHLYDGGKELKAYKNKSNNESK